MNNTRRISPLDNWIMDANGNLMGVQNPNANGDDLLPVTYTTDPLTGGIGLQAGAVDITAQVVTLPKFGNSPLVTAIIGNSVAAANPGLHSRVLGKNAGSFRPGTNAGVGGNKTADILARVNADIPTTNQVCFILEGTNDANAWGNTLLTIEQHCTNMRGICAALVALKILPVIILGAPWTGYPEAAIRIRAADLALAWELGIPVYDPFSVLIDATTGGYISGGSDDGTHPTQSGYASAATQFMSEFSAAKQASPVPLSNNAYGVFRNVLLITDTNVDGLADYWSKSGSATATIAAASGDGFRGNWQNVAATTGFQYIQSEIRSLPSTSDGTAKYQINAAIKYTNTSNSVMQCYLEWFASDGTTLLGAQYLAQYVTNTLEAHRVSIGATAPTGSAKVRINLTLNTATSGAYSATAGIAEAQIVHVQSMVTT